MTIGDLAAWPAEDLARCFGQHGEELARHARGIDTRPIVTERAAKSISQETTEESRKQKAEKNDDTVAYSEAFSSQLSALSFPSARQARLRAIVDALHARFGTGFVRREGALREEQKAPE